jgi:hypothetical protein
MAADSDPQPIVVRLVLHPGSEPLRGRVGERAFVGWMALMQILDELAAGAVANQ